MEINLHNIFCYLVGDKNFLSKVIEVEPNKTEKKRHRKNSFTLMINMETEYVILSPYETQSYRALPLRVKEFLSPDYVRFGIKNVIDRDLTVVNISFLNSLNILLRPELRTADLDNQIKNLNVLESFIEQKIHRNAYKVDKVKNTRKVQGVNKELIKNLLDGKISHWLVQCIVNIFEINLLVFDFTKSEIYFYWMCGHKYPHLNLFKNLHCMSYIHGNYEPVFPTTTAPTEQIHKTYVAILTNPEVKYIPDLQLSLHTLMYINSWSIPFDAYVIILERFFNDPGISVDELYDAFVENKK